MASPELRWKKRILSDLTCLADMRFFPKKELRFFELAFLQVPDPQSHAKTYIWEANLDSYWSGHIPRFFCGFGVAILHARWGVGRRKREIRLQNDGPPPIKSRCVRLWALRVRIWRRNPWKWEKPNKEMTKNCRSQTTPSQQDRTQTPKCPRECAPDVKKKAKSKTILPSHCRVSF